MRLALVFGGALAVGLGVLFARPAQAAGADDMGEPAADDTPDQNTTFFEDITVAITPSTYTPADLPADAAVQNEHAFLDMLSVSEGTSGPDGYRTLFGGGLFNDFTNHPRQYFTFTNGRGERLRTSAAGRYQFIVPTWDGLVKKLGLADFSPESQDAGALELIRQRGALNDVRAGRFNAALGIGAYWMVTRRAGATSHPLAAVNRRFFASPARASQAQQQQYARYAQNDASLWGSVGKLLGNVVDKIGSSGGGGGGFNYPTYSAGQQPDVSTSAPPGTYTGGMSGDPYGSGDDAIAANPVSGGVDDYPQGSWD